jgi:hypothetical protein
MSAKSVAVQIAHEWVESSLDKAADLDDLDATRAIAQTVRAWLASVDALDNLPTSPDILACQRWRNNAEMVAAVLGLLDRTGQIPPGPWCDLTYGEHGGWWKQGFNPAPPHLVRCIGPDTTGYDAVPIWHDDGEGGLLGPGFYRIDFRRTPFEDRQFAVVAFDPPYVLKGGAGKFDAMNSRYGVGGKRTTKDQLGYLIAMGLHEAQRVVKVGGLILAKGGSGVDGGKLFRTDAIIEQCADYSPQLEVVSRLIFPTVPRSQVHRGKQQSVRNNYSTLLVLRKVT